MSLIPLFKSRQARFEKLIRPRLRRLYRQAYRLTGDRDDAEDLVQDLLVSLYSKQIHLEKIDDLQSWLLKALYNRFIDNLRKRGRGALGHVHDDSDEMLPSLADNNTPSPDMLSHQHLELGRVQKILENLPDHHRTLIMLHDVEGFTLNELEPVLDVPLGTLKSRLHRARHALRHALATEPFTPEQRVNE